MSSQTNSLYDIAAALVEAEDPGFLGPRRTWEPTKGTQDEFLIFFDEMRQDVEELASEGLLQSQISWNAADINEWFSQRGFSIELAQDANPDTFYVGSIFELLVKWLRPGKANRFTGQDGNIYPCVDMSQEFTLRLSSATNGQILCLDTQDNRIGVYMTMLDTQPTGPLGLLKLANRIQRNINGGEIATRVKFPMFSIDNQVDLSWLIGMHTTIGDTDQQARITQAKQQTIIKVNHEGALAKSATGMGITRESIVRENPFVIDRPFLFWIHRAGYPLPLFAAWVDYTDWRDPGTLS